MACANVSSSLSTTFGTIFAAHAWTSSGIFSCSISSGKENVQSFFLVFGHDICNILAGLDVCQQYDFALHTPEESEPSRALQFLA